MDVISCNSTGSPSVLNPKAPMFVPAAYRAVEDFSGEWWDLVHSSPWFRDYWLQECFQDPENTPVFSPNDDHVLDDLDSLLRTSTNTNTNQESKERHYKKDLVTLGVLKWRNMRALAETPRYAEKAPKIVNKKVIPRPIQQPR